MYAVVRIRGTVGVWREITDAMLMMGLKAKHSCVLMPKELEGNIHKVKDFCTWGEIDQKILESMLEKRLKIEGKKVTKDGLNKLGAKDFSELARNILGKKSTMKAVFRLSPPSKGFKHSIKSHFPKGELGYRGEKINELLERMI